MRSVIIMILFYVSFCNAKVIKNAYSESTSDSIDYYLTKGKDFKESLNNRRHYNRVAYNLLIKVGNSYSVRKKYFDILDNLLLINSWGEYKRLLDINKSQCIKAKDFNNLARVYRYYGIYFDIQNKHQKSYNYFYKAGKILENVNNDTLLCSVLLNKADLERKVGNYLQCEVSIIRTLKISKRLKLKEIELRCYIFLGLTSTDQKDYQKGLYYYNKALQICDIQDYSFNAKAICLNNIGANLYESGQYKKAIESYQNGLSINNILRSDPLIYCRLIDNLGKCKFTIYNDRNSLKLYFKSSQIRDSLNIVEGKFENKLYLSEYFLEFKDSVKALAYANQTYNISNYNLLKSEVLLSLKQLAKTDPTNSTIYMDRYIKISDSINQTERETRNKFAKIAYETDEVIKEKDLAVLQRNKIIFFSAIFVMISILILIVVVQQSRNRKLQFAQSQQQANEEIFKLLESQHLKYEEGKLAEKHRMARDLHDGIMNKLASTRFSLQKIKLHRDDKTIDDCLLQINEIQNIESAIRNISHDLNDEVFSSAETFRSLLDNLFEEQISMNNCKWHIENNKVNWEDVESIKRIHIYRILQESLQNLHKYSKAKNVYINIRTELQHVLIKIHDDGIGFDLKKHGKGIGLQNLKFRVSACEGSIQIISSKNEGTTINIDIPHKNINTA